MKQPLFYKFTIISVTLHMLFMLLSWVLPKPNINLDKKFVEIDFITKAKDKNDKDLKDQDLKQVVQQDSKSYNEEVPEDSKLLSQKNQKVLKETISMNKGSFQNIHQSLSKAALQKAIPQLLKLYDPSDEVFQVKKSREDQQVNPEALTENTKEADEAKVDMDNLVSQSDDHVKDIDQGLETLLNTKEYKFYSYFSRIRLQLSQHWQPKVREKMVKIFHNGRGPASIQQERVTKLLITLNDRGLLVNVQVLGDSGIQELDDAAIEAFRAAAPFPNPPKGVVDNNGTVQIRWDFVLET